MLLWIFTKKYPQVPPGQERVKRVLEREIELSSQTMLCSIEIDFKDEMAGDDTREFYKTFFFLNVALLEVMVAEAWTFVLECWGAFFDDLCCVCTVATKKTFT